MQVEAERTRHPIDLHHDAGSGTSWLPTSFVQSFRIAAEGLWFPHLKPHHVTVVVDGFEPCNA